MSGNLQTDFSDGFSIGDAKDIEFSANDGVDFSDKPRSRELLPGGKYERWKCISVTRTLIGGGWTVLEAVVDVEAKDDIRRLWQRFFVLPPYDVDDPGKINNAKRGQFEFAKFCEMLGATGRVSFDELGGRLGIKPIVTEVKKNKDAKYKDQASIVIDISDAKIVKRGAPDDAPTTAAKMRGIAKDIEREKSGPPPIADEDMPF